MAEPIDTGNKTISGRTIWNDPETGEDYSERSTTFQIEGKYYTMPTVSEDGRQYTEDQIKDYVKKYGPVDYLTGETLPEFRYREDALEYAISRSSTRKPKMSEGGDVSSQTEEALGWTAEGEKFADANPVEVEQDQEPTALSIADVPVFDRPMDASENDKWTGVQDELGNRQYSTIFGRKYFVRLADDQRTNYEKIQQDIIPAVKNYLDNPTAPSREQTINFLKESLGAAWETFKIPGDLAAGNKGMEDVTLGNIFELAGGTGALSTVSKVPGDSSNTTRIFGGVGMKGAGTDKGFKKAKKLLKKLRSKDYSPFPPDTGQIDFNTNKNIWEQTNWYVDPNDGQWRFYIDDSKSELRPFKEAFKVDPEAGLTFKELSEKNIPRENSKSVLLKNFFDHTDLYEKYPELEELNVGFYSDPGSRILGSADSKNNTIYLNLASYENYEDMKSVVLHEIQHIVQEKEGFVPGSNERSIPPELVKKQEMEIATKIKPDVEAKAQLEREEKAIQGRIAEELEDAKTPLPGLTAEQEQEIFKIKPSDGGPSWASLGRKYGVPVKAVQKAWGRVNILNYLREKERELNLALTKIESNLFSAGMEIDGIEFEFYQGAGGEIESRLVQAMASGERGLANDGFPVSARNSMLGKEGNKYQYRGKEGVDPLVYTNQPRRDPDQKSFLDKLKSKVGVSNQGFAQGGVVEMNNQMEMLFDEGGIADDGMRRDPVSGNEIPPGSLAEEVRDDIPAQLSEGEYVVPADVVRFFGVKYFEDLRMEAKMGLSNMEANGRIGGEPIVPSGMEVGPSAMEENPLTREEMAVLEQMGMAVGGFVPEQEPPQAVGNSVQGFAPGGDVQPTTNYGDGTAGLPSWAAIPGASYMPQEWQEANLPSATSYKPVQTITTADSTPTTTTTTDTATDTVTATTGKEACEKMGMMFDEATQQCILKQGSSTSDDPTVTPTTGESQGFKWEEPDVDYFSMSDEDLAKVGSETSNKFEDKIGKMGAAALLGGAGLVGFGLFDSARQGSTIAEVRSAALVAAAKGNTTLADTLNARAKELVGKSSLLVQGADYFGALSGTNGFAQQIAAFSPAGFKLDKKLFGDNENAYKLAVDAIGKSMEKRYDSQQKESSSGVTTAEQQRAILSSASATAAALDAAKKYKEENFTKDNSKSTSVTTLNPYTSTKRDDSSDHTPPPSTGYNPTSQTVTTDPGGQSVTETTYTNSSGDSFTAGADEDGVYKGGLMTKRKKKK